MKVLISPAAFFFYRVPVNFLPFPGLVEGVVLAERAWRSISWQKMTWGNSMTSWITIKLWWNRCPWMLLISSDSVVRWECGCFRHFLCVLIRSFLEGPLHGVVLLLLFPGWSALMNYSGMKRWGKLMLWKLRLGGSPLPENESLMKKVYN